MKDKLTSIVFLLVVAELARHRPSVPNLGWPAFFVGLPCRRGLGTRVPGAALRAVHMPTRAGARGAG